MNETYSFQTWGFADYDPLEFRSLPAPISQGFQTPENFTSPNPWELSRGISTPYRAPRNAPKRAKMRPSTVLQTPQTGDF